MNRRGFLLAGLVVFLLWDGAAASADAPGKPVSVLGGSEHRPRLGRWMLDLGALGVGFQVTEVPTPSDEQFALRGHVGIVHRFSGSRSREAFGFGLSVGWPFLDQQHDAIDILLRLGGFFCVGDQDEFSVEALVGPGLSVYADRVFGNATVASLRVGARLDIRHYPDRSPDARMSTDGQFFVGGTLMYLGTALGTTFHEGTFSFTIGYTWSGIKVEE